MKNILMLLLLAIFSFKGMAQSDSLKRKPTIGLHFFYNDFATAQLIKANNLNYVIKNKYWSTVNKMQGGFGLDYSQGITQKIDLIGTVNASWVDYLLPNYTAYGSSNLMLDVNVGANIKVFTDKKIVNPYLITKAGYSSYPTIKGFNLIPGVGLQFNLFKEMFVNTTFEYRAPLKNNMSPQLYYSIGIATNLFKNKKPRVEKPKVVKVEKIKEAITKDIAITVNDEATGQPLKYVEVTIKSEDGNIYTATTNDDGRAIFNNVASNKYQVSGRLNKISTTEGSFGLDEFKKSGNQIPISLTHNDPRFTLVGNTVDRAANKPVGGTQVNVTNSTQNSTTFSTSNNSDGEFRAQLEAGSDFVVVGKKASYISNIENLSTKGLNRSATLYVKLELGIEEAKAGKSIVLNKIFFETGKSNLNTSTSADLAKLITFLKDNPAAKLEIQGHTDNVGSQIVNQKLSQERANSVVQFIAKNGIEKARLIAIGYGPSIPIADNTTPDGRAQNRRVEMKVLE